MQVKKRSLLTVQDLLKFCQDNNLQKFDAKDKGYKLMVQVPATFEVEENVDDAHRGMLRVKVRIFHTGLNRNGSYVSEDAAKAAMPTIKNRPVLGAIHQLDNGEWDFEAHNYEIVTHEDGTEEMVYIEHQIGSFDESEPFFEYDKELDKTYVCSYAYIPEEYTKAADIIRTKKGTKNSCELSIEQFSYNAKDKYLDLEAFYVEGSTFLGRKKDGTEIGEGMLGSRADIADFSEQNNPMKSILDEIKKLNETLTHFAINSKSKEGRKEAVTKFEELLEKYGKTAEDVTFEHENLSDEELEAKFSEAFEENGAADGEGAEPESTSDGDENGDTPETEEPTEPEQFSEKDKMVRSFEISHEDTRYALYNLLMPFEELDNDWYWITNVYDSYFVYENWDGSKIYRQDYSKDGDNIAFANERIELFKELLTASEKAELDALRSNYTLLEEQLRTYQENEATVQKDALFTSEEYSSIANTDEFKALAGNHADFSVDELKGKLDAIIVDCAKKGVLNFAAEDKKAATKVNLPFNTKVKKSRYGSLKFNN